MNEQDYFLSFSFETIQDIEDDIHDQLSEYYEPDDAGVDVIGLGETGTIVYRRRPTGIVKQQSVREKALRAQLKNL